MQSKQVCALQPSSAQFSANAWFAVEYTVSHIWQHSVVFVANDMMAVRRGDILELNWLRCVDGLGR